MAYPHDVADLEAFVTPDKSLEALSKTTVFTDVVLKSLNSVVTNNKPQL